MTTIRLYLILLTLGSFPLNLDAQSREFEILKNIELFDQIHEHLELYFVDEPEVGRISKVAMDEMLKSLDPYTIFYHESNIEDYRLLTTGEYGGIGTLIRKSKGYTYIVEPYENQPAHRAGLKAGDKILSIDGVSMKGKSSEEVSKALKGPKGTVIKVEIETSSSEVKLIEVQRDQIKIPDIPYAGMIENNIGYVKLSSFSKTAFQSVQSEYLKLKDQGMKTAILDLRNNGGGLLFEAVRIVNLFIPKGEMVVMTKGRMESENREFKTTENALFPDIPLVVLINDKSASASEIVAGALQDLDRAVIVGQQSFGKGLVQRTYDLNYGSKLKLTVSKYYTPSGRCVQRLDYYNRGDNDSPQELSDSMLTTFKTKNGREVIDGRGILPDLEVPRDSMSRLSSIVFSEDVLFHFVNSYVNEVDSIVLPKDYYLTDDEFNKFVSFVLAIEDLEYASASELKVKELKEVAEYEGLLDEFQEQISVLEEGLKGDLKRDLVRFRSEISPLLENEIVSRFYYQKGRSIHSFSHDKSMIRAKKVLRDIGEYNTILRN